MTTIGTTGRERLIAGIGTAIVLALFSYMLVRGLAVSLSIRADGPLALLDLRAPPPPPPPKPPLKRPSPKHSGKASAPNLKNKATPVVSPPPIVPPLAPPPIIVAPKPDIGAAASSGASDRAGPGTGAGGIGNGNGGGGDGDGDGGTPPRQIKGDLRMSDMPADLRESVTKAAIAMSFTVGVDGRVSDCHVTRSSGFAEFDAISCRLVEQRFRYKPARDSAGQPVPSTIVDETRSWTIDRSEYKP